MRTIGFLAAAALISAASFASAATVGVAVLGNGSKTEVTGQPMGDTDPEDNTSFVDLGNVAGTGADAVIGFFNPLSGPDCTFGTGDCGLVSDKGLGGTKLTMWLWFDESRAGLGKMTLTFEDQDFLGLGNNDPSYLKESLHVGGQVIDDLTGSYPGVTLLTGNGDTQQAVIDLGYLASNADGQWVEIGFSSTVLENYHYYDHCEYKLSIGKTKYCPRNTPEYVIATLHVVPLPATGLLLVGGVGAFAAIRRRNRKA